MDLCDQSTSKYKAEMASFYLHNMVLTNMNVWDPNARLQDLQLMAMASWTNHEELRVVEIRRLMIKEHNEPLMIRAEPSDPMALISTHNMLANNPHISPTNFSDQAQALHILRIWKGYLGMIVCMHV